MVSISSIIICTGFHEIVVRIRSGKAVQVRGRRLEPKGSVATDPQPNFKNSLAVEIAAEAALRHFKENPKAGVFRFRLMTMFVMNRMQSSERLSHRAFFASGRIIRIWFSIS